LLTILSHPLSLPRSPPPSLPPALPQGGTGYRDAQLLFHELIAKYGSSTLLLNGKGGREGGGEGGREEGGKGGRGRRDKYGSSTLLLNGKGEREGGREGEEKGRRGCVAVMGAAPCFSMVRQGGREGGRD